MKIILWFTRDLRLRDNAAFSAAVRDATQKNDTLDILPVYIFDTTNPWPVQGAAGWWLHHSLAALAKDLSNHGGKLFFLRGDPANLLKKLVSDTGAQAIYFSRAYDPHTGNIQQSLQALMQPTGVICRRFAGHLMMEPETVLNKQGKPFQVFTPYYNHFRHLMEMHPPPRRTVSFTLRAAKIQSDKLADWRLAPTKPDWAKHFADDWRPGEENAWHRLRELPDIVADYADLRDIPSMDATSRLSPHLCFGEISPGAIWHHVKSHFAPEAAEPFLRQLVWREFSYTLLHYWPHIPEKSFKSQFEKFPWKRAKKNLRAWQTGMTGYPIVDAGMRQLWQTGWMHNRVRMIVASFLTKHLLIHWKYGAAWFWDTLVDADLANNSAGWQWVAGSGADAAPYFRIFNPVVQGEKFDPRGEYVRRWVPELAALPDKYIHQPWAAPSNLLAEANIALGNNYPDPIVEHKTARTEALAAYNTIR